MEFFIKTIFRLIHISSGSFVIGSSIFDFVWGIREGKYYVLLQMVCGILLFISGLVNMVLLKPSASMGPLKMPWSLMLKAKIVLWFLFLPIPELICRYLGLSFSRVSFNLPLVTVILVISSFMKQYRDWAVLTYAHESKSK